jgi:hypothetical protein
MGEGVDGNGDELGEIGEWVFDSLVLTPCNRTTNYTNVEDTVLINGVSFDGVTGTDQSMTECVT